MKTTLLTACATLALVLLSGFAVGAAADTYPLPPNGQALVGTQHWVHSKAKDTLSDLARRFDLGYDAIVNANPHVDPWLPGAGTKVILPMRHILPNAPRKGIVLNLAEKRLYYYPPHKAGTRGKVITHPVGIGRQAWETPTATTEITHKIPNPAWYPPPSIRKEHAEHDDPLPRKVPAGADNPLGRFALRLGLPSYLIHGTNKPYGVGMRVSHGCIRLYPEDIAALFSRVHVGTRVDIVNQPYKLGWSNGTLYLEVHPDPKTQKTDFETNEKKRNKLPDALIHMVEQASGKHMNQRINWDAVKTAYKTYKGIPVAISKPQKHAREARN